MELRTISASSLLSFEECPSRYYAENVQRTPRAGGTGPADLGSAVHNALEKYVQQVYIDRTQEANWTLLVMLYKMSYAEVFGTSDQSDPWFKDGMEMIERWFNRTNLDGVQVLSVEKKDFIEIKTSDGPKRLNYIWDRCDMFFENGKKIIRVVDYKTIRANLSPEDLRTKLQARVYAMCAASLFREEAPDEIWIQFDLLRYGPVEVTFTRDKNLETWNYIKATAEKIIGMDPDHAPRKLGPGCMYCVLKASCPTLQKNATNGGIMSMGLAELIESYQALEAQQKASKYAMEEIADRLLAEARERNEIELEEDGWRVEFKSRKTRTVDSHAAVDILGPTMTSQMASFGVGDIEKLLKSDELSDAKKSLLRRTMGEKFGDPKPKVTKTKLGG